MLCVLTSSLVDTTVVAAAAVTPEDFDVGVEVGKKEEEEREDAVTAEAEAGGATITVD